MAHERWRPWARLVCVVVAALCLALPTGCATTRPSGFSCENLAPRSDEVAPGNADLSDVKAFRNYIAVTDVEPVGHHFTVWYFDVDYGMERLLVNRDPAGHLVVASEGGYGGGLGMPPEKIPPIPQEIAPLARELREVLEDRCHSARNLVLRYDGLSRRVTVKELIAHDVEGTGQRRVGWFETAQVAMDDSLTRVLGVGDRTSGFGLLEVPKDAQWLALPPSSGMKLLLEGVPGRLAPQIGEAAKRYASQEPPRALTSLVPRDGAMLPPDFVSRVTLKVSLYARAATPAQSVEGDLLVNLALPDAVLGAGASGDSELTLGGTRYRLHATLTPADRREPTPGRANAKYAGTLALRLDDGCGHAWQHAYPVAGPIELQGDQVVAPFGLTLPQDDGASGGANARRAELPGIAPFETVIANVDLELMDDPRR